MTVLPSDPPLSVKPSSTAIVPPPDAQILGAYGTMADALQKVDSKVWAQLYAAAQTVSTCQGKIQAVIDGLLAKGVKLYEKTGDALDITVYALLGGANAIAQAQGCPPLGNAEIGQLSAQYNWPAGPLPGIPPAPQQPPPLTVVYPPPPTLVTQVPVIPPASPVPPALVPYMPGGTPVTGLPPLTYYPGGTYDPAFPWGPNPVYPAVVGPPPPGQGWPTPPQPVYQVPPPPPVKPPGTLPQPPGVPGMPPGSTLPVGMPPTTPQPQQPPFVLPGTPIWTGLPTPPPYAPIGTLVPPGITAPPPPSNVIPTGTYGPVPSLPIPPGQPVQVNPPIGPNGQCQPIIVNVTCPPATATPPGQAPVLAPIGQPTGTVPVIAPPSPPGVPGQPPPLVPDPKKPKPINVLGDVDEKPDIPVDPIAPEPEKTPPDLDKALADWFEQPVGSKEQCAAQEAAAAWLTQQMKDVLTWIMGNADSPIPTDGGALYFSKLKSGPLLAPLLNHLVFFGAGQLRMAWEATKALVGCDSKAMMPLMALRALIGPIERWLGIPLPEAHLKLDYLIGQECGQQLPGPGEVDTLWLSNMIDDSTWDCWMGSNGRQLDPANLLTQARRTRPGAPSVVQLHMRGFYNDQQAKTRLREEGVIEDINRTEMYELARQIPGSGDIVTFMKRDSADEKVVEKFQYDAEFQEKFTGKLKGWAKAQGIDEETMKFYWRAHWQLPALGHAYEMMQRLRPGQVDKDVETVPADVEQLLAIADVPVYWRKRLMAISYHKLSRLDLRRAYQRSIITHPQLTQRIMDLGYALDTATVLADSWKYDRWTWIMARPTVRHYITGAATWDQLVAELTLAGVPEAEQQEIGLQAKKEIDANKRTACIKAVKRRVITGQLDQPGATNELLNLGLSLNQADGLAGAWVCEMKAKGKTVAASALCKYYGQGLISADLFAQGLVRVGYDPITAGLIIGSCNKDIQARQFKATVAAAKAEEIKQAKAASAVQKQVKAQLTAKEKAIKKAEQQKRAAERVTAKMAKAASVIVKATGEDPGTVRGHLATLGAVLTIDKGFSAEGAALLLGELAADLAKRPTLSWLDAMNGYVYAMPAKPGSPAATTGG